jgi:hypothetical protein
MKQCIGCKENKNSVDFCKNKAMKDGLNSYCKQCVKIKQDKYKKQGRCPRCGNIVQNKNKTTCENCRNIWGYDFTLVKFEDIPQQSGNYILYCPNVKGVYIGASCNLKDRIKGHLQKLKSKKHKNKALQNSFDALEYIEYLLIGINICAEEDIYQNESIIWKILKEKNFNIFNQQKPKLKLYQCLSNNRINKIYSKIVKLDNGCWHYNGALNNDGYCYIEIDKEHISIHRIIYTLEQRKILQDPNWEIPKKLLLRHICHNKQCCNPLHLIPGTDKENMQDSVGKPRKKNPFKGQLITAWGETKPSGAWMVDPRRNPDIQGSTLYSRFKRKDITPEEALTMPLSRRSKNLNEKERQDRLNQKIRKADKNRKKFILASTIRQLYEEGEHIDDLLIYFSMSRQNISLIVNQKKWYNPSITGEIPSDYIRKYRNVKPEIKYSGVSWNNGYYYGFAHISPSKIVYCGRFNTEIEAAKIINVHFEKAGLPPPNRFG